MRAALIMRCKLGRNFRRVPRVGHSVTSIGTYYNCDRRESIQEIARA
jgi:hypothetical protein